MQDSQTFFTCMQMPQTRLHKNLLDFRAVWCYNTFCAVKHCAIDSGRGCA